MKTFLSKLVLLIVICLLAGVVNIVLKWHSAVLEIDRIYEVPEGRPILCLGASHIECSIADTKDFCLHKKIWLSSFRSNAALMRLVELERRRQLNGVTCLVSEIAPWAFAESFKQEDVEREALFWMRELPVNWRHMELFPFKRLTYFETIVKFFAKNAFRPIGTPFTICETLRADRPQLLSMSEEWQKERFEHYRTLHYANYANQADLSKSQLDMYGRMLEVCNAHRMKLILIVSPLSSTYRAMVPDEAWSRMRNFVEEIKQKGALVFDRRDSYPDELFYDPTHLTLDGAKRFTEELYAFLRENSCLETLCND